MRDSPGKHRPHARKASPPRQESIALTPGQHRPHARTASTPIFPSQLLSKCSVLIELSWLCIRLGLCISGLSKHAATTLPHASAFALDISMLAGLLLNSDVRRSKGIGEH